MMDDSISRQAFMSHIESEYRKWGEEYDAYQIISDLENFPSAQSEEQKAIKEQALSCAAELLKLVAMISKGEKNEKQH